jgi:predicted RNA-binding protein YlxR (DUF448 family)
MIASESRKRGSVHAGRERTCAGCAKKSAPEEMVRLVLGPKGADEIAVDAAGGAFGRGAYVHHTGDCLERACHGGLSRAFKTQVAVSPKTIEASIRDAYERRALGMLLGARRAGHLTLGADAAAKALAGGAPLVVIAADAGSVTSRFERAVAEGRAVSFGTKAGLGEMFGTGETAVFAVCHEGVANALQHALAMRGMGSPSRLLPRSRLEEP